MTTRLGIARWSWYRLPSIVQGRGPETHREAHPDDPPYEPPRIRLGFPLPHADDDQEPEQP